MSCQEVVSSNISYIYGLTSSDDISNFRYVGYTNDINIRKQQHLNEARNINKYHRHHWINKVLKNNNEIIISPLGCFPEETIQQKEMDCIKALKDLGYNLTNGNAGGVGGKNPVADVREKIRLSKLGNKWNIGRKKSKESCEKLSKALTGKTHTKEHREKLSIKMRGRKTTNYRVRKLNEETICEIYKLYNLGNSQTKIEKILNINRKTIGSLIHNENNFRDIKEKYSLKKDRPENFKWEWSKETRIKIEKNHSERRIIKLKNKEIEKELKKNIIKERINKIFDLYNSGLTELEISKIFNTDRKNINRVLNKKVYEDYSINLIKRNK